MIIVRFPDPASERRGLGCLAGRFRFTTRATGETLVPEAALPFRAAEGITVLVEGVATYELRVRPLRCRRAGTG